MRKTARIVWPVFLGLAVACSSGSGGTTDPGTVADVTDLADVPADVADVADVADAADAADTTPPADVPHWEASATPGCVGDACAAGPDAAPDPMAFGPFPVGLRRVEFVDKTRTNKDGSYRTLVTEVWYPTTEAYRTVDQGGDKPKFEYDILADGPQAVRDKFPGAVFGTFPVQAVKDAPVRHGDGRFPLVMFSHGAYGIRYQSVFYTVPLASHGYVVVAPDHQNNDLYDLLLNGYHGGQILADSAVDRPVDIRFLMDRMAEWDADPANDFYQSIEADNVGVAGHSFGGWTCFSTGSYLDDKGNVTRDPRVKAVNPQAPAGYLLPACGISDASAWPVPTMMMGGEMDETLGFDQAFMTPWKDILGAPKWFLDIKRGGHFTFSDICRLDLQKVKDMYPDAEDALNDGCAPTNWDWTEAGKAINLYGIAIFNVYLRHSEGSRVYLTAEAGKQFGAEIEFLAVPQ